MKKDQHAACPVKCASITTNQASRVMKAATASAFFIGTGAANRKRQASSRLCEKHTHTHPTTALWYSMCKACESERAEKRPLSSIARKYFNYSQTPATTRGKSSNFITSTARHAWPNEMRPSLPLLGLWVYFMVQRRMRDWREEIKSYGFYI
jgi:hypothetical protein